MTSSDMIPNEYEIRVLKALNGDTQEKWGAWFGACVEFLQGGGFVTRGQDWKLTQKGKDFLRDLK
jgi:hypothetical protein